MTILSTLRESSQPALTSFAKTYSVHRPLIQRILTAGFTAHVLAGTFRSLSSRPATSKGKDRHGSKASASGKAPKVAVDAVFYQRLARILRLVIPGLRSKEALLLLTHTSLLIFRTAISLYVAALDGKIVASLVRAQTVPFLLNIIRWLLVAIPATWTNSWLSYIQNKLAIAQMITHDIQKFSNNLAAIYANLAKPVLDVILYNYQLSQNVGAEGLVLLTVLIQLSAALLRKLTPPFGAYTSMSAQLLGALRHTHSRLVEFAEEIAFFGGEETEKLLVEREYAGLVMHEDRVLVRRWWHGCIEEGIVKWLWGSFGLVACAIPVFFKLPGIYNSDLGSRTEGFVTNRRLLLSSSDAVGRVMYSYKDLSELAGYTARVSMLLDTIEDTKRGKFEKALVSSAGTEDNSKILKGRGKIIESEGIRFENVPIVTPNGDVLVKSLSFFVKPGRHLLIVGPNVKPV
ncbi:ABC transporter transmembrane region 2-domain-containing protein [Lactarius quietus]|nr:ABC transporter transmembrane region 2-domain-containing protein [Lactarius quietus]